MTIVTLGAPSFSLAQTGFSNVLDVIRANARLEAKEAVFTGDVAILGKLSADLDASDIANLDLFLSSNIDFDTLINDYMDTSGSSIANDTSGEEPYDQIIVQSDTVNSAVQVSQTGTGNLATIGSSILIDNFGNLIVSADPTSSTPTIVCDVAQDIVQVNNLVVANGMVNYSDRRIKENIVDTKIGLKEIEQLKVVEFDRTDISGLHVPAGFIAQDLAKILPKHVFTINNEKIPDLKAINTTDIIPVLVKAIQELSQEVKNLKTQLL